MLHFSIIATQFYVTICIFVVLGEINIIIIIIIIITVLLLLF
jgi:hypothetical protein